MSRARDELRSARLLLDDALVSEAALASAPVRITLGSRPVPSGLMRRLQARKLRSGRLGYLTDTVPALMEARRAVLGDAAAGPPRALVWTGQFPAAGDDPGRGAERLLRAHEPLTAAGLPHLLAVRPRASDGRPLEQPEIDALVELRRAGTEFALAGLDGRPRGDRGELEDLPAAEIGERLERAAGELAEATAIRPAVLAPVAERLGWRDWHALAEAHDVVLGGPAAVGTFGYHHTPLWRGDAVWMPAYPPFHGPATSALDGLRELDRRGAAIWTPVALRWEHEEPPALADFAREAAGWAASWPDFLAAVARSAAA